MDTKTFHADTAKLSQLSNMLAGHGVIVNPNQPAGEAESGGWDVSWQTPEAGQIAFSVIKHPFAEEGIMWGKLSDILGPAIA